METISKSQMQEILNRLSKIEARIDIIANCVTNDDSMLSEGDIKCIKEAEQEYQEGRTISHEELKKELGLKCSK